MGLESATYINQLNALNPVGATDPKSQGDDHLRLIKSTLQASFPNIAGAMNATHTQLNALVSGGFTGYAAPTVKAKATGVAAAGSATTILRSDMQLLIDLADAYNWSGTHFFSSTVPSTTWIETDAAADEQRWKVIINTKVFMLRAYNDAESASAVFLQANRGTGAAITSISLGNATDNPLVNLLGRLSQIGDAGTNDVAQLQNTSTTDGRTTIGFINNRTTSRQWALGIDTGGGVTKAFEIRDLTGAQIPLSINTAGQLRGLAGAAATPTFSFIGDSDTGIWNATGNEIDFATNGVNRVSIANAAMTFGAGVLIRGDDGTLALPGLSFANDTDTGLARIASNQVQVVRGGTDWGALVGSQATAKSATTSRNTTTTLTDDPHLVVALPIGTYSVEAWVPVWGTTTGTQGIKFALAFSGTAAASLIEHQSVLNGGNLSNQAQPLGTSLSSANIVLTTAATDWIFMRGTVIVTVAGNLSFQWAQNSSSANNTNVGAGGYLTATRLL